MLRSTAREPSPWSSCRFEAEANEPEILCAYCQNTEVVEEGDFCSEACAESAAEEHIADTATTYDRENN